MLVDKILEKIKKNEKILLILHENPDGDTLAAASTFYQFLKKQKKEPVMVCKDLVPRPFLFLPEMDKIGHDFLYGDFDLIFCIDCGDLRRTGFPERLKKFSQIKKTIINIDHHPKNDLHKIAQINFVDYNASSTCEIVWDFLRHARVSLDKEMATALYTGLFNDTGGFKHSNTSSKTLIIAGELLNLGARIKLVTKNLSLNKSVPALKLWGIALSRLHYNPVLNLVSSVITNNDLIICAATTDDIAGVVNLINSIPNSKAAILFYETADKKIRASLRTEDSHADVSKIAAVFGGGGHKKASGFTIDGQLEFKGNDWKIILNN